MELNDMSGINCKTFYRYHRIYDNNYPKRIIYDAEISEQNIEPKDGFQVHPILVPRMCLAFLYKPYTQYLGSASTIYYRGYMIRRRESNGNKTFILIDMQFDKEEPNTFENNEAAMLYIDMKHDVKENVKKEKDEK